jgi:hypothetical protein
MLCAATLMSAYASSMINSPSTNSCMIRVRSEPTRYFNDPYNACVVPPVMPVSPSVTAMLDYRKAASCSAYPKPVVTIPVLASVAAPQPTNSTGTQSSDSADALVEQSVSQSPLKASSTMPPSPTMSTTVESKPITSPSSNVTHYAVVRFKYESFTYIAPFRVAIGDTVVVEGDRGEHAGKVEEINTETPSFEVTNRIVRKATAKDRQVMEAHREKEVSAVATCRRMADNTGLGSIKILDAEFQFDMNKLTIYFRAKTTYIDFRKLQRGLFKEFRCRIWLAHMDEVEAIEKQRCR